MKNLKADLIEGPSGWENTTIGDFLEAISAWAEDMDGYYKSNNLTMPTGISWNSFARILLAAKHYE